MKDIVVQASDGFDALKIGRGLIARKHPREQGSYLVFRDANHAEGHWSSDARK